MQRYKELSKVNGKMLFISTRIAKNIASDLFCCFPATDCSIICPVEKK